MTIRRGDCLHVPEAVVTRKLGDEAVLLNVETGMYYGLDSVGARFLELLQEGGDLGAVRRAMLSEFDVTPEALEADLLRLTEEMVTKGLLVRDSPA